MESHTIPDTFIFCSLFIDESKIDKAISKHLGLDSADDASETKVTVCPYDAIWDAVKETAINGAWIWVWYIHVEDNTVVHRDMSS